MPSVSRKQATFMRMSLHARDRLRAHGVKPAPRVVAREFVEADRARKGFRRRAKRRKGFRKARG